MKILASELSSLRLRLARPLVTAFGSLRHRDVLRLSLRAEDGSVGRGEAAPLPAFGTEGLAAARTCLEELLPRLRELDPEAPAAVLAGEARALAPAPTACAALDGALHDLAAQAAGLSLAAWLSGPGHAPRAGLAASRLLVAERPAELEREARAAVAEGFTTLKLKVGHGESAGDAARLAAARRGAGAAIAIGVDANGAWTADEAPARIEALAPHGVAWVEQPVAAADIDGLARVRERSPVPVAADEAAQSPAAARRVLEAGAADLLVLKPAALGGVVAAAEVAALAREARVGVSVTSLLDGAVGIHTALHFAAALPEMLFACGLATGTLLHGDPWQPPRLQAGVLALPKQPGLGLRETRP